MMRASGRSDGLEITPPGGIALKDGVLHCSLESLVFKYCDTIQNKIALVIAYDFQYGLTWWVISYGRIGSLGPECPMASLSRPVR